MRKSVRKDRSVTSVAGIAERHAETVRPALGQHAAKKLARLYGCSIRRAEQLISPSDPRPPTTEQLAKAGRVFGDGWVRFVLFGGDESAARARLEARRQARLAELEQIERELESRRQ